MVDVSERTRQVSLGSHRPTEELYVTCDEPINTRRHLTMDLSRKGIENAHTVSQRQQATRQVCADKARATGNKNSLHILNQNQKPY